VNFIVLIKYTQKAVPGNITLEELSLQGAAQTRTAGTGGTVRRVS
jgi:hypothetical protein